MKQLEIFILFFRNPKIFFFKTLKRIQWLFLIYIYRDSRTIVLNKWLKDKGDVNLRLNCNNLNEKSIVFDVGGYNGNFTSSIYEKYRSNIYLFEPHPKFFKICSKKFKNNKKIKLFNFGLSNKNSKLALSDNDVGSSFVNFPKNKESLICKINKISDFIENNKIKNVDLMKINIEGGEYALLQELIDKKMIHIFQNIQVQFHNFEKDDVNKKKNISKQLQATHNKSWCYEFVWENWELISNY